MADFRFQFQYDPDDLKTIRDTTGVVRYSPATTISVWAGGFAVCLLMLGAIGAWTVLFVLVIASVLFVSFYVHRLSRRSFSDREYLVRTVTLTDSGVTEEFGHSMSEKSWDAFEEFVETPNHLLLRHYEKITAIPKRAIPAEQFASCRNLIASHVNRKLGQGVELFRIWFDSDLPVAEPARFPVYSFRWRRDDIEKLTYAKMRMFDREANENDASQGSRVFSFLVTLVIFAAVVFLMFYFTRSEIASGRSGSFQILLFPLAISIPFLVALVWWRYTSNEARKKLPRIPDEEIFITVNDSDLMIGYPNAVARYSWQDISAFCYSEQFVGFRPQDGLVHVIANHAFGGQDGALAFLRLAKQLKQNCEVEIVSSVSDVRVEESGNPYQPPNYLKL